MSKTTAIILLVFLAALLFIIFRILLPSIKLYISRMPKGIFVLLFIVIIGASAYLIDFLINDRTGGLFGNDNQNITSGGDEVDTVIRENCIIIRSDGIWVENEKAEKGFLDYVSDPGKVSFPWTMIDKITTYDEYLASDEMARKRFVYMANKEDDEN